MSSVDSEVLNKAIFTASNLLSYRPRSRYELQQALVRKGHESSIIAEALTHLENNDLIDDRRFAKLWAEDRLRSGRRSRLQVQLELRQKGVGNDIIEGVMSAYSDEDEIEAIRALIAAKQLNLRYPQQKDLYRYLAGKGFSGRTIKSALAAEFD